MMMAPETDGIGGMNMNKLFRLLSLLFNYVKSCS
jgi:hypothetical protein